MGPFRLLSRSLLGRPRELHGLCDGQGERTYEKEMEKNVESNREGGKGMIKEAGWVENPPPGYLAFQEASRLADVPLTC